MNLGNATLDALCLRLLETLTHFLWQGAALALVAGLLMVASRRASARVRYAALLSLFALMALSPLLTFAVLPQLPRLFTTQTELRAPSDLPGIGTPSLNSSTPIPSTPSGEPLSVTEGELPPTNDEAPDTMTPPIATPADRLSDAPLPSDESEKSDRSDMSISAALSPWQPYLNHVRAFTQTNAQSILLAYLLGVGLMLFRLMWAVRGGRRLRRHSLPVNDAGLLEKLGEQARVLGLRVAPAIAYCERVAVPTVVGIFRPMILLPLFMVTGFSPAQLELILRHELAHIRRYDHLVNILQRIAEAFLFFHPGVWYLSRLVRIEREHCCDDLVLDTGGEAVAYADSLVRIAERGLGKESLAAVSMASRPSDLRRRIIRLLEGPAPHVRFSRMGVVLVLMLLAGTGAAIQAATRDQTLPEPVPAPTTSAPAVSAGPYTGIQVDVDGQTVDLGKGTYLVALVTATCDRCKEEVASLNKLAVEPSVPKVVALMMGEPDELEQFRVETTPLFPTQFVDTMVWLNLLDDAAAPPRFELVKNGTRVTHWDDVVPTAETVVAYAMADADPTDRSDLTDQSDPSTLEPPPPLAAPVESLGYTGSTPSPEQPPQPQPDTKKLSDLLAQLNSSDEWLRQVAAQQLGDLKDEAAVGDLAQLLLQDTHAEVKVATAEALGKIGGPGVVRPLVAALRYDGEPGQAAVRALSATGETPAALALLRYAASDSNYLMRAKARMVLASYGTGESLSVLFDSLKGDDAVSSVISELGPELAKFSPDIAVPIFLRALHDGSLSQQVAAAYALASIDRPDVNEALATVSSQAPVDVRKSATRALGSRNDESSVLLLTSALHDPAFGIRVAAAEGLRDRRILPSDPADLAAYNAALGNWSVLPTLGNDALEPLVNALTAPDEDSRRMVAFSLGAMKDPAAVPALIEALRDPEDEVRQAAASALGTIGDRSAVPALIGALTDDEARYSAAESLGRIGDPAAIPALIASLKDLEGGMRKAAAEALATIGDPQAIQPLVESLRMDPQLLYSDVVTATIQSLKILAAKHSDQVIAALPEPEPAPPAEARSTLPPRPVVRPAVRRPTARPDASAELRALAEELREQQLIPVAPGAVVNIDAPRLKVDLRTGAVEISPESPETAESTPTEEPLAETPSTDSEPVPNAPADTPGESDASELATQLRDEDWWLRQVAAQQLGLLEDFDEPQIGKWFVVEQLIKTLKDEDPRVQAAAAESLGKLADPKAIKHLVAALKEEEPVRSAAAEALAKFDPAQTLELVKLALADEKNENVRLGAVAALQHRPPDVTLPLIAEALKTVKEEGGFSSALYAALTMMPPSEALPVVTDLAKNGPTVAAKIATLTLVSWTKDGNEQASEAWMSLANDPAAAGRMTAVEYLWEQPGDQASELLIAFLEDPSWEIRVAAAKALEQRNYFPDTPEARAEYYVPLKNWDAVANLGQTAVGPLMAALEAPLPENFKPNFRGGGTYDGDGLRYRYPATTPEVPAQPAFMLAKMGVVDAFEGIAKLLQRESPELRMDAAAALQILNDSRAVPVLVKAMQDPNAGVRYNVLQALRRLNTPEAIDAVIAALHDPDPNLRTAAAQALGEMKAESAVDALSRALEDVNESVGQQAMWALGEIGGSAAVDAVASFLAPDKAGDWRERAVRTLGRMGSAAVPPLLKALTDSSESVQADAMASLAEIGDPAAIEAVAAYLAPERVDNWNSLAIKALGEMGPQAIPYLETFLAQPDSEPEPNTGPPKDPRLVIFETEQAKAALDKLKQERQQESEAHTKGPDESPVMSDR